MAPRHIVAVSSLVRNHEGHVLLVKTHSRLDTWELPGGQVEEGEGLDAAAVREVFEETGIVVRPLRVSGVYYNATMAVLAVVFVADYIEGTIRLQPEEIQEARFVALTEDNVGEYVTRPHQRSRTVDALRNQGYVPYETWKLDPYRLMGRLPASNPADD